MRRIPPTLPRLHFIGSEEEKLDRYQYLLLIAGCLVLTLPLELLLGVRVWRAPGRLVRSVAIPVLLFLAWDALAIDRQNWFFSRRYTTGWRLPFRVPVEDLVFVVTVAVWGVLAYEAFRRVMDS